MSLFWSVCLKYPASCVRLGAQEGVKGFVLKRVSADWGPRSKNGLIFQKNNVNSSYSKGRIVF